MKPFKSFLVFLLIAALLLTCGCSPRSGEESSDLSEISSQSSLPETQSSSPIDSESSSEPEPAPVPLTGVYLGRDGQTGQERFFLCGEERSFPSEDILSFLGSAEDTQALPSLLEGNFYTLSFLEESLVGIVPVSDLTVYSAKPDAQEVYFWALDLKPEGITVSQAEEPLEGAAALIAAGEDRADVYLPLPHQEITPPLFGEAGVRTRRNLLLNAFAPVGTTLYVPEGIAGSGEGAVPAGWADFFSWQDETYLYTEWESSGLALYQTCGIDNGGYIAYVLENVLETGESLPRDTSVITSLEEMGLGMVLPLMEGGWPDEDEAEASEDEEDAGPPTVSLDDIISLMPGDLICTFDEVWIVLGTCADGSLVVFRCAPTLSYQDMPGGGVQLSAVGSSTDSLAYHLVKQVTENIYPLWSERYDVCLLDPSLMYQASCFVWTDLSDPEGLTALSARQIITSLLGYFPESETQEPRQVTVDPSWFDDAVFIGDSITEALRMYAQSTLELGNAKFLSSSSLSAVNALWSVSDESVHPKIGDTKMRLEDAVPLTGAKKVYIMLGMNSIAFGIDLSLEDLQILVGLIKEKTPDAVILIESVTPMVPTSDIMNDYLNNYRIAEYNLRLQECCEENGWYFINVYEVMQDGYGNLNYDYCSDPYAMGIHMTNAGVRVWIDYLLTHVPEDLT